MCDLKNRTMEVDIFPVTNIELGSVYTLRDEGTGSCPAKSFKNNNLN